MTEWQIYLWTRLDSIHGLTLGATIWAVFIFMISGIILMVESGSLGDKDNFDRAKLWVLRSVIAMAVFATITVMIPTTQEAAAIYLLPKIANRSELQQIPDKTLKLLNARLDQYLEDAEFKGEK